MQLGVDKLYVLLIHRPDPLLDPEALAGAFIKLRDQGKVLHFGVSNFSRTQFDTLQSYLSFPLVTNQVEISLFLPQPVLDGTLDHLMQNRTSAMAWSPLGGGKFLTGENEASRRVLDGLIHFGPGYQASPSQLLLAWLLRHPSRIFPVIGTTKPERLAECSRAAEIQLDRQDWFEMLQWATGKEVA
jgi:predicted oxidoreductase